MVYIRVGLVGRNTNFNSESQPKASIRQYTWRSFETVFDLSLFHCVVLLIQTQKGFKRAAWNRPCSFPMLLPVVLFALA